jgi:hypothetical protein
LPEKIIGIEIGIGIEIDNHSDTGVFDPNPDSDFDLEKTFERKHI